MGYLPSLKVPSGDLVCNAIITDQDGPVCQVYLVCFVEDERDWGLTYGLIEEFAQLDPMMKQRVSVRWVIGSSSFSRFPVWDCHEVIFLAPSGLVLQEIVSSHFRGQAGIERK